MVAALFVRSLVAMQTMDFGFKPDHVMNFVIDSHQIGMTDDEARDLAANITARLHQLAGVDYVSHAGSVPLGYFSNGGDRMVIDGAPVPANPSDLRRRLQCRFAGIFQRNGHRSCSRPRLYGSR